MGTQVELKKQHLLLVDDDEQVREPVSAYLQAEGYSVSLASGVEDALALINSRPIDLIILDIMLEKGDGFSLCRTIRKTRDIPIIFLSGRADETERIIGLEVGADDYLVKPFNPRELLARIRAVIRRYRPNRPNKQVEGPRIGPWRLDLKSREMVDNSGQRLSFSSGEFKMLQIFAERPNETLSRDQLLELVQGRQSNPFDRSIDNYISRIRKKIELDPAKPQLIKTQWGAGYIYDEQSMKDLD